MYNGRKYNTIHAIIFGSKIAYMLFDEAFFLVTVVHTYLSVIFLSEAFFTL